jgi:hypothetical protein
MSTDKEALLALYHVRSKIEVFMNGVIRVLDGIDAFTEDLEDVDEDDDRECEPSLGATEHMDQREAWRPGAYAHSPDLEAECACLPECACAPPKPSAGSASSCRAR